KEWTDANVTYMTKQLRSMGNAFSWDHAARSTDPEYFSWTQWMFTRFFEEGIAYRGTGIVNWCPGCNTVIANEQVTSEGCCERSGDQVEKREMPQWMLRITKYADRLIDDLDALPWPEHVKEAQRQWIGRSVGAKLSFELRFERHPEDNERRGPHGEKAAIPVFTTRPDTLFGATYLVLAPEHPWVTLATDDAHDVLDNKDEVRTYVDEARQRDEKERTDATKEKTGVELKGVKAVNPATGEEIPMYVADYVLAGYGTGAIMAVPAHDERDYAFATKFGLLIRQVIDTDGELPVTTAGKLINSGEFDGIASEEAKRAIVERFGGEPTSTYRLRDWSIGRQRYWGVPVPIVYDPEGNPHSIPKEHLPWTLPTDVDFKPTGEPPLAKSVELQERTERIFGPGWTPDVETMDTFVDSSWYFLRYVDPHDSDSFSSKEAQRAWMPVDLYFGGAEHTTMHLLYSRFWQKALYDLGLVTDQEPYTRRVNRGLVLGPDGAKMSKSKGNVIDPDREVERLGADAVKMYLAFMGPYGDGANYPWDMGGIAGLRRFLERANGLRAHVRTTVGDDIAVLLNRTIAKVTGDIDAYKFNTAISALMIFQNAAEKDGLTDDEYCTFLRLLAPFAPHLSEELWHEAGKTASVHEEAWPTADPALLEESTVTVAVQVNGKTRGTIEVPRDADESAVLNAALADPLVGPKLAGERKRVIYVANKVLNVVL
ncbi:MAG TPA: leucine--tRNA ligase, partial [Candidatus Paceibacterota bacterium]|nr:leucine--tRNA ligase [Candidatus Paceibacterota bacterium]